MAPPQHQEVDANPLAAASIQVLPLTPEHLADVTRLHKFSSTAAGSVFGARDLTEVLAAAAGSSDG